MVEAASVSSTFLFKMINTKFFLFLQSTLSMEREPEKILSHVFKMRMKTQMPVTVQIEAST